MTEGDTWRSLTTEGLQLIPATAELVRAEIGNVDRLFDLLQCEPAVNWPPEETRDALAWFLRQLETAPSEAVGWLSWYWILRDGARRVLIGGGGFKGAPGDDGVVEIGYSVRPGYRRRGFVSEAVAALVGWALRRQGVKRVVAETRPDNVPSVRVLEKAGFRRRGNGIEPGTVRFERSGGPSGREAEREPGKGGG